MRWLIAASSLFLFAFTTCGNKGADGPGSGTVVSAKDNCPVGDLGALTSEQAAAVVDGGTALAGPPVRPPEPTFTSRLLDPPGKTGQASSDFTGCLSLAEATAEAGARFPVPPTAAGPQVEQIRVSPLGEGVVVSHDVSHACCLQGEVSSKLEGTQLILTERLVGTACDCRCASTIRSAVGLPAGKYTVVVRLEEGASARDAFTGEVNVTK